MKSFLLLFATFAFAALAHADDQAALKARPILSLKGVEIKVKFTSDTIILTGEQYANFPTTANTKNCAISMNDIDYKQNRRIRAGVEKSLEANSEYLAIQGQSEISTIFCKPNGSVTLQGLSLKDIEDSAGGTMTFTVTVLPPRDVT